MLNKKRKNVTAVLRRYATVGTIGVVSILGTVIVLNTRASSPAISIESESGVVANGAITGNDTSASAGKFVRFTAPSPGTGAAAWIGNHFKGITPRTGTAAGRQNVETPAWFKDYANTGGKYGIDAHDKVLPTDRRIGLVNVNISNNASTDIYGASLYNAKTVAGSDIKWYLKNVTVEPNWPTWISYSATNYDGITLDNLVGGTTEIYAEDLTVRKWNADAGIDNKTSRSEFVRLVIEGPGHRSLRVWRPGPHYLVDSRIDNPGGLGSGSIIWFSDCSNTTIKVWNSTFNGSRTVPANKISCDNGSNPNIIYLATDPRKTGEMHPMFGN